MDGTLYVLSQNEYENRHCELAQTFCKLNDIMFQGEGLSRHVDNILKDVYPNHFSVMNPDVYDRFLLGNIKNRAHFGKCTDRFSDEEIHENGISKDIMKCYRSCIQHKLEPWIISNVY